MSSSLCARRILTTAMTFTTLAACSASRGGADGAASLVSNSTSKGDDPNNAQQPSSAGTASRPTVSDDADAVTITNGLVTIHYDKHTGLSDYVFGSVTAVKGAYASVDLGTSGGGYVASTTYAAHALASTTPLDDAEGTGIRAVLENTSPGKPTIAQIVTLYAGSRSFDLVEQVTSADPQQSISSKYLGAIIVDGQEGTVTPGPQSADPRVLDVPFDNDAFVRYDSRVLGDADFSGTGYEVTTVYDSASRNGLVVGSVTHDFWKTGIYYEGTKGRLKKMNVWGGASTPDQPSNAGPTYGKDGTHDVAAHGAMTGAVLTSPTIFVGFFDDWRDGLEAFGKANARITPMKTWAGPAPFGWMSWGAFGLAVTADKVTAVSDFLKSDLTPGPFGSAGPIYVNVDAGLKTDPAPLVQHIHANGQKAGTYRVPFSYFAAATDTTALAKAVSTTGFTYSDIVLRDDSGNPIRYDNGYVLDVTHPGTRTLMKNGMASVVAGGFDFVKLDFMTHGAFEGHHYDPQIKTGMQAYNQAMTYLTSLIPPNIFVSLSIAPLFPSGYAHSRRISCDVVGQLNDVESPAYPHYGSTEYMLNSLTYGWWESGSLYAYTDPDAMALYHFGSQTTPYSDEWARTHVTASAIAGTVFLDSSDYTNPAAATRSVTLLGNTAVDAIARGGVFRPLDGDTGRVNAPISGTTAVNAGSAASDVFVRVDAANSSTIIAAFNYDASNPVTKTIDLGRVAGLDANKTYAVTDMWASTNGDPAHGSLAITLAPGQSKILRLQ